MTVTAFDVFLTVNADMSEEEATAILNALYESLDQLKADYPPLAGAAQELLPRPTNTVHYHDAAVAFYTEKGLWSEENEAREAAFQN